MENSAVEWLANEFKDVILKDYGENRFLELIEQAKEMEKQQIIDAYDKGDENGANRVYYRDNRDDVSGEQYYNETFKTE